MSEIVERKLSHIDLCAEEDVEAQGTTLLEEVHLLHESLPELSCDQIDSSVDLLGRRLHAPILVSGMTGGAARAGEINRALAMAAQKFGLGMGVGSQRAMLYEPELAATYRVRDVAPDILLLANIGAVQAREAGIGAVRRLVSEIGADALCLHLNPAQELVQDEGDRDFRGCEAMIQALVEALPVPVVVKETGCGMGPGTLRRIRALGVSHVDVSGAGGTTWTGVEALRGSRRQRQLGLELREWGVPTAPCIVWARAAGLHAIASGGLRRSMDVARSLALGACATSLGLPFLRAFTAGGERGVLEAAGTLVEGLRALMLLTGVRRPAQLQEVPRVIGPRLAAWLDRELG